MLDYFDHSLFDEESYESGTQVASHEMMYYPSNTMRITLNSQKDVIVVDNDLMATEKEIIERTICIQKRIK